MMQVSTWKTTDLTEKILYNSQMSNLPISTNAPLLRIKYVPLIKDVFSDPHCKMVFSSR